MPKTQKKIACLGSWYNKNYEKHWFLCLKLNRCIFYMTCSKWPLFRWWRLNSTSEVINHPDAFFFSMARIFWLKTTLDSAMDCSHTHCPSRTPRDLKKNTWGRVQIGWMRIPLGFAALVDQPIGESIVEPLYRDVGCNWSCLILMEPLHISIHTTMWSKCLPERVHHINETLFCDTDRLFPTEPLTASTLSGHLPVNFLSDLGFSASLFRLFTGPVVWNLCTNKFGFSGDNC